tara:strand:- start:387 stop:743 length:357 start_codon:yes stop_codon:yes gene_type:complete
MNPDEIWNQAICEHNGGDYHEAHELFEDLWLELDDRSEKDIVQTLAQADALAVHLENGNTGAAQRLMRQLPELITSFPSTYRETNLAKMKEWINRMIELIPRSGEINEIKEPSPPKLV